MNKNLSDRPNLAVPPGRTLADMPKGEPIPTPDGKPKPANARLTLRQLITHGSDPSEKHPLIELLIKLGTERTKGPWKEYLQFFRDNITGDMDSFAEKDKLYVEKLIHDLEGAYAEAQKL